MVNNFLGDDDQICKLYYCMVHSCVIEEGSFKAAVVILLGWVTARGQVNRLGM